MRTMTSKRAYYRDRLTTYYEEVRDVLDEEGGSDEVVDVDVGFLVDAPEVVLPEVLLPAAVAVRDAASWESTKGLLSD